MTRTKKILFFLLVFIALFGSAELIFSQQSVGRDLEIKYPEIAGEQPEKVTTPIPEYIRYIYNGLIWISGLIALIVLIIGGFEWFTSAGSIDRIRSAKNRISAAILGIIILFGSYLILISINPELVVFHLPRLRPIISELTAGVLVCTKEVEVKQAWNLTLEYKTLKPSEDREREIKKKLDELFDKIAIECYTVSGAGNIRPDFDNKVKYVYFIPSIELNPDSSFKSIIEYGAIIYEDSDFNGFSKVLASNLIDPLGSADAYMEEATPLKPSSIKPFTLIYKPDPNWKVTLYQDYDGNKGLAGAKSQDFNFSCGNIWWCGYYNLPWSPKSMKVEGDILAILCKHEIDTESCEAFSKGVDNNLEDNLNIVEWKTCKNYTGAVRDFNQIGPSGRRIVNEQCAWAAATNLIIISASIY